MATTTNYGWTTPDDTALVKDGAAAIRSLGSAIDSTLKTQIDAQIPDSLIDAKGDLIVGTADNTPARLASSGVNGNVLTVDTSTASGLKWGAVSAVKNFSLLSTTSLSGATTSVTGLSGYDDLFVLIRDASGATANRSLIMRINDISTASNYREFGGRVVPGSTYSATSLLEQYSYFENNGQLYIGKMENNAAGTVCGYVHILGANSSGTKVVMYSTTGSSANTSGAGHVNAGAISKDTAVVSSLTFYFDSGNLDGGTVYIYGAA